MDQELRTYLEGMEARIDVRFTSIDARFTSIDARFTSIDARFTSIDARFTSIDDKFAAVDASFNGVGANMQGLEDRMAALIAAEVGNLHTEMQNGFARVDERLDRQGFILEGGTKALAGMLEHFTKVELDYDRMQSELSELRGRVEKLEKRAS
jgi:archaellum component FlaC